MTITEQALGLAPQAADADVTARLSITEQALDLTGDGHGRHIPGSPMVYRHGFIPIDGTELGKDGIRRPGKNPAVHKAAAAAVTSAGKPAAPGAPPKGILSGPHPADRLTVASNPAATAKAMSGADLKSADQELSRRAALLGKLGQKSRAHAAVAAERQRRKAAAAPARKVVVAGKAPAPRGEKTAPIPGDAAARNDAKALDAAVKSGVASRKAPGQGAQGSTEIITYKNGAQYIRKDFKDLDPGDQIEHRVPRLVKGSPAGLQGKKLQVAKEAMAAKVSDAIGAGAPAVVPDPGGGTGFYEPKIAGKPAVEVFKGDSGRKGLAKMYSSPEGLKIGLMDMLTGHEDRHLGNVMITPGGKPVPIDHNDTWGGRGLDGTLFTDSPFAEALDEKIDAGKSPFTAAGLDQVKAKIEALKPEFEAMPGGNGTRYYHATMAKLAQVRGRVAGQ